MYSPKTKQKVRKRNNILAAILLLVLPVIGFPASDQEKQLFGYMNSERSREDVPPLIWDEELYLVALAHSKDMADMGRASHRGSDRSEPHERIRDARIYAARAGENIARDVNVVSAHTLLMQSVDHRANILERQYTHAAVAIVREKQFLYITELFIHKVQDYPLEQARQMLVRQLNHGADQSLPLILSESLSQAAQAHVETQAKLDSLTPMLTMSPIARSNKSGTLVSIYTTTGLLDVPDQVRKDLEKGLRRIGIGYKRVQGAICSGGCYLIVLVMA